MPDYSKTMIYKLICDADPTFLYVGSTVAWHKRKCRHKTNTVNAPARVYEQIRALGGWDQVKMILIETHPCNNKLEAHAREQYWIDQLKANMNSIRAHTTREQFLEEDKKRSKAYHEANREEVLRKKKTHYQANKEEDLSKKREKVPCECGSVINRGDKARHCKTNVHKEWETLAGI
ncbi:GIY-YIG nuclease family protein [bacterium]|nr:GIY-YIG nuclease family protein [bacterium]